MPSSANAAVGPGPTRLGFVLGISARVHVLYKVPEIPANNVLPAIAFSVSYWKHEKAENTGSTPVSATNSCVIIYLQNRCTIGSTGTLQEARPKARF